MTATCEHYLDTAASFDEEPKVFNLLQVITLNGALALALGATARAAGIGWGGTLLVGWLGGTVATLAVVAILVHLLPVLSMWAEEPADRELDAAAVRQQMIEAWDRDAEADRAAGAATRARTGSEAA